MYCLAKYHKTNQNQIRSIKSIPSPLCLHDSSAGCFSVQAFQNALCAVFHTDVKRDVCPFFLITIQMRCVGLYLMALEDRDTASDFCFKEMIPSVMPEQFQGGIVPGAQ